VKFNNHWGSNKLSFFRHLCCFLFVYSSSFEWFCSWPLYY